MLTPLLSVFSFLRGAARRLPIETAIVALAVVTVIHLVHAGDPDVWHLRLLFTSLIAGPLVFSLHERERTRRHATVLGAAITGAIGLLLLLVFDDRHVFDDATVQWALILLVPAAYLVPFIVAAPRFFLFVRRFFEELTTWVCLAAVAATAIAVVGFSIEELFHVNTKQLTSDAGFVLLGAFVLIALERLLPDRAATGKVPELWRRLATAVGAPFVVVMMGILTVYEITVIAAGELPSNQLSPLLIGAGLTGYLCTLILTAVAAEPVGSGALSPADPHSFLRDRRIRLARAFPIALLALLPMALWALIVRIEQYGLTPFRVVRMAALLCLVVLGVLGSLRWLRGRPPLGWHVPATFAAFAIAISVGPLSAVNLSVRSQTARVDQLLAEGGVAGRHVGPATTEITKRISLEQWNALRDAIDGVVRFGGEPALRQIFSGELEACVHRWRGDEACLYGLGLGYDDEPPRAEQIKYDSRRAEAPVQLPSGSVTFVSASDSRELIDGKTLRLRCDDAGGLAIADLSELLAIPSGPSAALPPRGIPLRSDTCADPGVFAIQRLETKQDRDGLHAQSLEGVWVR